ncbi:MAG TPA: DUF1223 domain-containing protein [Caulobacteraceae bacterium]
MTRFKPPSLAKTLALAAAFAAAGCAAAPTQAADAAHPTVVELFQSQGCSSCPPANANLLTVADRPDVLALSFGVTYWDDLGWKDTFATPQYTARQWDYAHGLGHTNVFTPQVVVNGRHDGVGADPRDFAGLIRAGDRGLTGPAVAITGAVVTVGAAATPARTADIWLARYDPRIVQVPIKRGENGGKTLPHRNVVRELVRLGAWNGKAESLVLPPSHDANLKTAILIQLPRGGPILAAARG